jgi:PGF-CTERM protein
MNPGTFTRKSALLIILTMFLLILLPITLTSAEVTELKVTPQVADPGDIISITGKASPNEPVWISSSFELPLTVSDGTYSREFIGIDFPKGEKDFSVTAENVKNIQISLCCVFGQTIKYPLDGPKNATNGIATLSVFFPATWGIITLDIYGTKTVTIYGDAAEGATSVTLTTDMSIKVTADSNGNFELDLNTGGVPEGEFLISAGGKRETVYIGVTPPSTPTPSPSPSPTPTPSSAGGAGGGGGGAGGGSIVPETTPTPTPMPNTTIPGDGTQNETATPSPSLIPTPTPATTTAPQTTPPTTPIETETEHLSVEILPKNTSAKPGDTVNYKVILDWRPETWEGTMDIDITITTFGFEKTYEYHSITIRGLVPPIEQSIPITIPDNAPPSVYKARVTVKAGEKTATDETSLSLEVPGFEAVFALVGLLAVAYLLKKRG